MSRYQGQRWYTNTTRGGKPVWCAFASVTDDYEQAQADVLGAVLADREGAAESAYRVAILDDDDGQHDEIDSWEAELRQVT